MAVTKTRIDRYAATASLKTAVVVAGAAAIGGEAVAEIVYQSLSISLDVPTSTGVNTRLDIDGLGWIEIGGYQQNLIAWAGATGTSSSPGPNRILLLNDDPKTKKGGLGNVLRFAAGDAIGGGGDGFLKPGGIFSSGTYGGNFNAVDGPVSGYIGWGYVSEDGIGHGWLSVNWDGSLLEIDGYAYETEVQTSIEAGAIPAPGALGLLGLAAGASGLRRTRKL